jgi:3-oxoacyl-[acyl-carrier protein] reductase
MGRLFVPEDAMDLQLVGKRALVTGSSIGIGEGIARRLAAEGALVILHGRNVARLGKIADDIRASGGEAAYIVGDLESDEGAAAVAAWAAEPFNGVDILVNNAGGRRPGAPNDWFDIELGDWTGTFNQNVLSAVRMIKALAGPMKERGWGRIVNISSMAGQSTSGVLAEYAAAKAAINNLTLGLAKVLAMSGVTANSVSPGMIRTPGLERVLAQMVKQQGFADVEAAGQWMMTNVLRQSVGRLGEPEDVADTVAWLASPRSDFVNGANIRVDGGASPAMN